MHPPYRPNPKYPMLALKKHYDHYLASTTVTRLNLLESP
jgi:hypothetical protein